MNPKVSLNRKNTHKILRGIWNLVYILFFKFSPRPLHAWRIVLLKLFGAQISNSCLIYPSAKIWAPWNLKSNTSVVIGDDANLYNVAKIVLEEGSVVSQGAFLCSATHNYNSDEFNLISAEIHIKKGAWICAEAYIGPGVVVDEFAIVAARSVVTRDVSKNSIVGGNPARKLSERQLVNTTPGAALTYYHPPRSE